MKTLKDILYNCNHATFLIEKKQITKLSRMETLELKIHLSVCSVCKIYERQSLLITGIVKKMIQNEGNRVFKLDDAFKLQLQRLIERKMNKN